MSKSVVRWHTGLLAPFRRVQTHFSSCLPSCIHRSQIPDSYQIVCGGRQREHPSHQLNSSMTQLSHPSHSFHPAEDLFYPIALLLANRITGVPRRPSVNGTPTSLIVLRHVRRDVHVPCLGHEVFGVICLVGSYRDRLIPWHLLHHDQRRIPLRCAIGLQQLYLGHQSVSVLHQHMPAVAEFGLFPRALLHQQRICIRRGRMRLVAALLSVKIHRWIAAIVRRWLLPAPFFWKLFNPAQASNSVPSTVKCSSDMRSNDWACSTTNWKNCFATSASSRRFRFLVNTVTSHTGSSIFNPTNHRNSMLYSNCSISIRSLRTV